MRRGAAIPVLLAALAIGGCAEFNYGSAPASTPDDPPSRNRRPPPTAYTVERGDTLHAIAWRFGLDYRNVADWNAIDPPYTIYPGQALRLKPPVRESRRQPETDPKPASANAESPPPGNDAAESDDAREAPPSTAASSQSGNGGDPDWRWPVDGDVLQSFRTDGNGKRGIAIGGHLDAPVRVAAAGRVVYSGNGLRGYGNLVIVKHGARYLTAYGFNRTLLVAEGDRVESGQTIARMGERPGGGAALHFELRRDGRPVDPLDFLPSR